MTATSSTSATGCHLISNSISGRAAKKQRECGFVCLCKWGGGGFTLGRGSSPWADRWGNPRRPSTCWPSQEVVSWAAEKSDYLPLPTPPTKECVCVFALSHLNGESMNYIGNRSCQMDKHPLTTTTFAPPAFTASTTPSSPPTSSLHSGDEQAFPYQ